MAKAKPDYNDPLHISNEMLQLDMKNYEFYDTLTEEQKKAFSPYLMLRWGACVHGGEDIQKFYAAAMNEYANNDFFLLSQHKKLQWLMCCASSPGLGRQKHYWLGAPKKSSGNKLRDFLLLQYPNAKESTIDSLMKTTSKEEYTEWLQKLGLEAKEIKELLKNQNI